MKKSQLLIVMALMTAAGVAMTALGFLSLGQAEHSSDFSFAQAWSQMWELHPAFGLTMAIYCTFMLVIDLWAAVGAFWKNTSLSTGTAGK